MYTIFAALVGPSCKYWWNLHTGEFGEHTFLTPPREVDTIIAHRPRPTNGRAVCGRCDTRWPCNVLNILEAHLGYKAATINLGAKP